MLMKSFLSVLLLALLAGCAAAPGGVEARKAVEVQAANTAQPEVVVTLGPSATPAPLDRPTDPPADAAPQPAPTTDPASPRGIVEAFYRWYFEQPQGQVVVNRTFFDSPLLSDIFKSDTNFLLDSMVNTSGYDPFTCAQNNLPSLTVAQVFTSGGEAHALAEVVIDGQVRHYFVVSLSTGEGAWKIDAIRCPRMPETAAYGFYTWYLGSVYGDVDAEKAQVWTNPIANESFLNFFLLTDAFKNALIDGASGPVDPVRGMDRWPARFSIAPGQEGTEITVRLDYDARTARYHTLRLVDAPAGWMVDGIAHVEVPSFDPAAYGEVDTSGWQAFRDREFGFTLRYPTGWWSEPARASGLPADDPLRKGGNFYAPGLGRTTPVLWLHVLQASEAQLIAYYPTEDHQEVQVNGRTVWVDHEGCAARFLFRHPSMADTWLVIGSSCPSGENSDAYAKALEGVLAPLLRTVTFE